MKMLKCTRCGENKPEYKFHRATHKYRGGRQYWCKECTNENRRNWRARNPGKDSEAAKRYHFKRAYGMTLDDYYDMLEDQLYKCAICNLDIDKHDREVFDVDHDHKTGKVRALLCHRCNKGLGCFDDDIQRLKWAVDYLERHKDD